MHRSNRRQLLQGSLALVPSRSWCKPRKCSRRAPWLPSPAVAPAALRSPAHTPSEWNWGAANDAMSGQRDLRPASGMMDRL
jgi:hypothetical protein